MSSKVDPVLAAVIGNRLKSITQQMALALLRTARSLNLSEARDFCTGLYDLDGGMIEQTEYVPGLAYTVPPALKYIYDYFQGDFRPGDIIIHNDPFTGGNQLSDVKIAKPIFYQGQHVAWAAINAHQADIGGAVAGGYNPEAREIWQEAIRITPVKLYEAGQLRQDVWDLIFANVRLDIVSEDVRAVIGGCNVAERELIALIDQYGLDVYRRHVEYLYDASERLMRREIEAIPDGTYYGSAVANYDGVNKGTQMEVKVAITVEGSDISFDFTGSSAQTPGFVNAPFTVLASAVVLIMLMSVDPNIPHNRGMLRPIKISAPEGTFLNPTFPAATGFGNHLKDQIFNAIILALEDALPHRLTAGWNPLLCAVFAGYDPDRGRPFADLLINACKGGGGGTYGADGYDHIGIMSGAGGIAAQDPEMFELEVPVRFHKFEYLPDSAGPGRWRGGLGIETVVETLVDDLQITVFGDGTEPGSEPPGIRGGKPGTLNRAEIIMPTGERIVPMCKDLIRGVPKGSLWHQVAGGGGGYGDPFLRPPERVAWDVRLGYVTPESARRDYGVVITDARKGEFDAEATRMLRRQLSLT
ncbi:MAG TPA: hydantoinase B/oxoprolinase family protein [Sphingobacteriaceae bacterium]|nr:hydantoinase B/oxoprolinase family protein [Sphingobacteriaceae bacterium]